jgi:hypothetical protein
VGRRTDCVNQTYLISKIVFLGFAAAWFLAASPTNRSSSVKATYDGVIRFPWSLTKISTLPFCITPTQEYVVPRSIPMTTSQSVSGGSHFQNAECVYQSHNLRGHSLMESGRSERWLSEEEREGRTKEAGRKEPTSPKVGAFEFLAPL